MCLYIFVCVRSPGARGCVKYNCCVRKWKVSICQSGGTWWNHTVSLLRDKLSVTLTDQWQAPLFNMRRCGVMMSEYHRYWRGQLKCISSLSQQGDTSFNNEVTAVRKCWIYKNTNIYLVFFMYKELNLHFYPYTIALKSKVMLHRYRIKIFACLWLQEDDNG